jgi:CheY-like chemotaxis protein
VLVGGNGPTVLDRVLAFGDAWMPNNTGEDLIERAAELRARTDRPIDLVVMGARNDPAALERLRDAGCRRVVRWIPSTQTSGIERALERWESTIAELNGEA